MATPTNFSGLLQADNVGGSSNLSAGFTFTAGRSAVVQIVHYSASARLSSISVGGTSATLIKRQLDAAGINASELWLATNLAGGTNVVVAYSGASDNYVSGAVTEWDGTLTVEEATVNGTNYSGGYLSNPSISTAASTSASETVTFATVVQSMAWGDSGFVAPAGWTSTFVEQNSDGHEGGCGVWISSNSADTKTANFTALYSVYAASIASFSITASGSAPVFTTQPSQQSPAIGAGATLSVATDSATSYQWQTAPASYGLSNVPGTWSNISGAVSSSYTTAALTAADNGRWFRVVATNAAGSTTSNPVRVFALGLPLSGTGALEFGTGWMMRFRASRQQQSNALARARLFPGDTDSTESAVWGDFLLPTSGAPSGSMAGAAASAAGVSATLTTSISLSGAASATASSSMSSEILLAATVAAVASAAAAVSTGIPLAGAALGGALAAAALTAGAGVLSGAVSAVATAASNLVSSIRLGAASSASAAAGAALSTGVLLAGSLGSVAAASASLSTGVQLASVAGVVSTSSATLTVGAALGGVASCASSPAAALTTGIALAATSASNQTATAALSIGAGLSAATAAQSQAYADLSAQIRLSATPAAAASAYAGLQAYTPVSGGSSVSAATVAHLSTAIQIQAGSQAQQTSSASLTTAIRLSGSSATATLALSELSTQTLIAGQASSSGQGLGELSTSILLSGGAEAYSYTSSEILTEVRLAGSAQADSVVGATLKALPSGSGVPASPDKVVTARARTYSHTAAARSLTVAASPRTYKVTAT